MTPQTKQRLCSEIQLFDLCSLDSCSHRDGRFCTKGDIIAKFEAISDDDRATEQLAEDADELDDDMGYDDGFDEDEYGGEEPADEDDDF